MSNTAVLVAVKTGRTATEEVSEHLEELALLSETAGIHAVQRFVQNLPSVDPRTFVRKGKLDEIKAFVFDNGIHNVIFDDDLSPSQLKNLEKVFNPKDSDCTVQLYDRSLLILDIFLYRARTSRARTQVELAMNQYLLPRLTRMWTHLERQRGNTGTRGGAGEKEIETDRRNIRSQISVLKSKLLKIDNQSKVQRKSRQNMVRVSLVGYTNAGKSTLMNVLSRAHVKAENKLFATVDTIVRKVMLGSIPFLLSDTVGFIRKLPAHLVESFKSTLDEVSEADVLLHVADVAHPFHSHHINTVNRMLVDIGAGEIPVILVLNKVDSLKKQHDEINLDEIRKNYLEYDFEDLVFISASGKENIDVLTKALFRVVERKYRTIYPNYIKKETFPFVKPS